MYLFTFIIIIIINTAVGSHFLLQGIFPTQGSNPGLLHCRQILYYLSHQRSPINILSIIKHVLSTNCVGGTLLGTSEQDWWNLLLRGKDRHGINNSTKSIITSVKILLSQEGLISWASFWILWKDSGSSKETATGACDGSPFLLPPTCRDGLFWENRHPWRE